MKAQGTDDQLMDLAAAVYLDTAAAVERARLAVPACKREIAQWQAHVLYAIAKASKAETVLEVGTALGFSAAILASALPNARIVTLNPKTSEVIRAREYLKAYPNVQIIESDSDSYYGRNKREFDFVFVDGDHQRVGLDLRFFNRLTPGGTIMFHDYSPEHSSRPCPPVVEAIDLASAALGRPCDIMVVGSNDVGMAGFLRQSGEHLEMDWHAAPWRIQREPVKKWVRDD